MDGALLLGLITKFNAALKVASESKHGTSDAAQKAQLSVRQVSRDLGQLADSV